MPTIEVCSRRKAAEFTSDRPWAAISISTYRDEFAKLNSCQRVGLLQLAFADIDTHRAVFSEVDEGDATQALFGVVEANQILDFVNEHWDNIDTLLVHCEAGVSRSPATAAAISKIKFGKDDVWFKNYIPNRRVYRVLLETAINKSLWTPGEQGLTIPEPNYSWQPPVEDWELGQDDN